MNRRMIWRNFVRNKAVSLIIILFISDAVTCGNPRHKPVWGA